MTTEHLPQLDAIATLASGRPTRVYLDDSFPLHLRGLADYDSRSRSYRILLNPVLTTWARDELDSTVYHECLHIALGHVNVGLSPAERRTAYVKTINHRPQTHDDAYPTIGQQIREIQVDQGTARLRSSWPFSAYPLWKLITQKETYP